MWKYSGESQRHAAGETFLAFYGPWHLPCRARLRCPDGKLRMTQRVASEPDTFWTIPCAVKVRGKMVTGYLSTNTDTGEYEFHPSLYRKNGHIFETEK
jgi:hypothetical protein